ncbi:hypothetical protein M9978_12895 [Sphingomonas sp. MG17]|uniref:Uncharacterized protein n=1 Tax=Sphingomonas tagetis TaxID=2949092 RepID=A0A9X2HSX7_9SPHN|nr:hypothetical protein [Sphingomonas tagetis]MCP3731325.1 hypothetical protein [Sphingomonas tagetis]
MPTRSWCIVSLALFPSVLGLAPLAQAQSYRPDAEGYPCSRHASLGVVATAKGFVIEARTLPSPKAAASRPVTIALGASLKIDRALLDRASTPAAEADNAEGR